MSTNAYRSIYRPGLFAGQTVIVTGGGSGIGRCIAHELASLGAALALVGRKIEKLQAVQAEIAEAAVLQQAAAPADRPAIDVKRAWGERGTKRTSLAGLQPSGALGTRSKSAKQRPSFPSRSPRAMFSPMARLPSSRRMAKPCRPDCRR